MELDYLAVMKVKLTFDRLGGYDFQIILFRNIKYFENSENVLSQQLDNKNV